MTLTTTLHLNFAGQARAALDHYAAVFGGDVVAVPYGDTAEVAEQADQLVWGQVTAPGLRLMAYDVQASPRAARCRCRSARPPSRRSTPRSSTASA